MANKHHKCSNQIQIIFKNFCLCYLSPPKEYWPSIDSHQAFCRFISDWLDFAAKVFLWDEIASLSPNVLSCILQHVWSVTMLIFSASLMGPVTNKPVLN